MIPILFEPYTTDFTTNGIGRLYDTVSCTVVEERNGTYELTLVYPLDGKMFNELQIGRIIYCRHSDKLDKQAFVIYNIDKTMNSVTVAARHISYQLNKITLEPFTATSVSSALAGIEDHSINDNPFTFWTDKSTSANFKVTKPEAVRAILGGQAGSILDVYGGEYEFDMFTVKLHQNRGQDGGVTIRYGKNLTDLKTEENGADIISGIVPYWQSSDGTTTVMLPERIIYTEEGTAIAEPYVDTSGEHYTDGYEDYETEYLPNDVIPLDLSGEIENAPTVAELRAAAENWLDKNGPVVPNTNLSVSFVALWQTAEYENIAPLQRVGLCDWVTVIYPKLGVKAKAQVVSVNYDVLLERYNELELGHMRTSLYETITEATKAAVRVGGVTQSELAQAIDAATQLIRGGLGGYVVMSANASGEPQEILIMDTPDTSTAVNVIRINKNGIGFSTTGYNGPFTTAWTIDGSFTADFITAGTMSANRIRGGTLQLGGTNNQNGVLQVYNSTGTQVGYWDNTGLHIGNTTIDWSTVETDNFIVKNGSTNWVSITSSGLAAMKNNGAANQTLASLPNANGGLLVASNTKQATVDPGAVEASSSNYSTKIEDTGLTASRSGQTATSTVKYNEISSGGNIKFAPNGTTINILEAIYPIGSIYMSIRDESPATLFGFGTWTKIGGERFLMSASTTYPVGQTGGAATHSHAFTNLTTGGPSETETTDWDGTSGQATGNTGVTAITADQMPSHRHALLTYRNTGYEATGYGLTKTDAFKNRVIVYQTSSNIYTDYQGNGQGHDHTLGDHTHSLPPHSHTLDHTHTIPDAPAASHLPRYYTVYIWRRSA